MKRILTLVFLMILGKFTLTAQEKTGNHKMNSETSKSKSASKYYERGNTIKEVKELSQSGSNEKYYIAAYNKAFVYSEVKQVAKSSPVYSFYSVAVNGSRFDKPKNFDHNAPAGVKPVAVSFNNNGTMMYATCLKKGSVTNFTMYEATKLNNKWTGWKELEVAKSFESAGFPVISGSGDVLYFCAKSKGSKSGYDIYSCTYNDGWQKSSAVPGDVNSDGDDMYPTLFGDVLFYSSGAKGGEGSSDIIFTDLKSPKRECFNAGSEINSKSAEKMMILNADNKTGVLISNRKSSSKPQIYNFVAEDVFIK